MASKAGKDKHNITAGVKYDFEQLLKDFTDLNTVRYEEFAKQWRKHKMSLLCAGRITDVDAREFMTEVFKIAVQFSMPPFTEQTRIGALYLLHGLYYTQPCQPKVLIRMTCPQWNEMMRFQDNIAKQGHHDVNFIFLKLYQEGAFAFVALKNVVTKGRHLDEVEAGDDAELKDDLRISNIFNSESLMQLSSLHEEYTLAKTRLAGPGASQPDRSLNMTNNQLVPSIMQEMEELYKKIKSAANVPGRTHLTRNGGALESGAASRRQGKGGQKASMLEYRQDSEEEEEEQQEGPPVILSMPTLDSTNDKADVKRNEGEDRNCDGEPPVKKGRGKRAGKRSGRGRGKGKGRGKNRTREV